MKLILLGYMGCGKSTIAKALSKKIALPFIDLDDYIERIEGKTIGELFKSKGEIYFRKIERQSIEDLMERKEDFILALGGGTACYYDTMEFLNSKENVITVYLKTNLDHLVKRLFLEKSNRPLIAEIETQDELKEFIAKHIFERSYFYNKAQYIINNSSIEHTILQIEDILK
jgi:shikimate kinase